MPNLKTIATTNKTNIRLNLFFKIFIKIKFQLPHSYCQKSISKDIIFVKAEEVGLEPTGPF